MNYCLFVFLSGLEGDTLFGQLLGCQLLYTLVMNRLSINAYFTGVEGMSMKCKPHPLCVSCLSGCFVLLRKSLKMIRDGRASSPFIYCHATQQRSSPTPPCPPTPTPPPHPLPPKQAVCCLKSSIVVSHHLTTI